MSEPRPNLVLAADRGNLPTLDFSHPLNPRSQLRLKMLGDAVGMQRLGVHLVKVPAGHESFIHHSHYTEEELVYVLSGRGVAELGTIEHEVGAGDFMGFPTPSIGHHLRNESDDDLVYLVVGERLPAEICEFPRAGKRLLRVGMTASVDDARTSVAFPLMPGLAGVTETPGKSTLVTARERADLPTQTFSHPFNARSEVRIQSLGDAVGLQRIGLHVLQVPSGKESYLFHTHHTEEEFVYVLSGTGIAEIGEAEYQIGPGDFLGFPTPSPGHHLRNASGDDLVYLSGGERHAAEIVDFPRAGKRVIRVGGHTAVHPLSSATPFLEGPLL